MDRQIVISIDAMSGDKGPAAVIDGLASARRGDSTLHFLLHGDESELSALLKRKPDLAARCAIRHCADVVAMDAKPSQALRRGRDSSMYRALESVAEGEAVAAVSSGNTGALMTMAMVKLRKAEGVDRPAITAFWPSRNPSGFNIVLDMGADIQADARNLLDYAVMGSEYARASFGIARPRVGLLNVGTEETKGRKTLHEAAEALSAYAARPEAAFSYAGFIEGGDIPGDRVDVVVTDGFTGNVALKTAEGIAKLISEFMLEAFAHSILSRIGALFALSSLRRLKKRIDPRRVNGGVFLGLNGLVVKSHGGADATGFTAAVELAACMAEADLTTRIAQQVEKLLMARQDAEPESKPTESIVK